MPSTDTETLTNLVDQIPQKSTDLKNRLTKEHQQIINKSHNSEFSSASNESLIALARKLLKLESELKVVKITRVFEELIITTDKMAEKACGENDTSTTNTTAAQSNSDNTQNAFLTLSELKVTKLKFPAPPEVCASWRTDLSQHFEGAYSAYSFMNMVKQICCTIEEDWKTFLHNKMNEPDFESPKNLDSIMNMMEDKLWELYPHIKRLQDTEAIKRSPREDKQQDYTTHVAAQADPGPVRHIVRSEKLRR